MITRSTPACAEPADLVGGERLAGDVDERLRPPAGRVAEALGLAAAEDDRLHWLRRWLAARRPQLGRPIPS